MTHLEDITPEGSPVPIYRDAETVFEPVEDKGEAEAAARRALMESAVAKLQALGLTIEEATAIVGAPLNFTSPPSSESEPDVEPEIDPEPEGGSEPDPGPAPDELDLS